MNEMYYVLYERGFAQSDEPSFIPLHARKHDVDLTTARKPSTSGSQKMK